MKKIIPLLVFWCATVTASDGHKGNFTLDCPDGKRMHVTINLSPNLITQIHNHTSNENLLDNQPITQTKVVTDNQMISSMEQNQSNKMLTQMINTGKQAKEHALTFLSETKNLIWNHKFKCFAVSAALIYGYFFLKTWKAKRYAAQKEPWFAWKINVSMEDLLAIPQKELAQELVTEIQKRYIQTQNPENFLLPFTLFMQNIEQELKRLKSDLKLHRWIIKLRVKKIFPLRANIELLQEKIQRLVYFQNIFTSWMTEYKLAQNSPEKEVG